MWSYFLWQTDFCQFPKVRLIQTFFFLHSQRPNFYLKNRFEANSFLNITLKAKKSLLSWWLQHFPCLDFLNRCVLPCDFEKLVIDFDHSCWTFYVTFSGDTEITMLNMDKITLVAYFWIYYVMNTVVGPGEFICRSQLNLHRVYLIFTVLFFLLHYIDLLIGHYHVFVYQIFLLKFDIVYDGIRRWIVSLDRDLHQHLFSIYPGWFEVIVEFYILLSVVNSFAINERARKTTTALIIVSELDQSERWNSTSSFKFSFKKTTKKTIRCLSNLSVLLSLNIFLFYLTHTSF